MFYDYLLFVMNKTITENDIGQQISTWLKVAEGFMGDVQPTTGDFKASMGWGDDVKGQFTLYTGEKLTVGGVVSFNDITYEVEKMVEWDYFIYSLKRVDL